MRFEFATATRIIFGAGTVSEVGPIAAEMGKSAFVVTGKARERALPILERLDKEGIQYAVFSVPGEPTTIRVKEGIAKARSSKSDLVIGIGGGSAIDTGKAVAVMLTNPGELEDYLEVVGRGRPITQRAAPYIAIPTTAGTGAEVTSNAVLLAPKHKRKVSMRTALMLPHLAVVDPELSYSMPQTVTASTGLDALTQLLEVFVSNKANPLTDGICREGLRLAGRSLRKAYEDGTNGAAREGMSLASLFGGLALANAKLGAVHGFAGPLGGMISAPHGVICARLLPFVFEVNVKALQKRAAGSPVLERFDEAAKLLRGDAKASAADGMAWLQELCKALKVPALSEFGLREKDLEEAAAKSKGSSSMKGNPIELTDDDLIGILNKAL